MPVAQQTKEVRQYAGLFIGTAILVVAVMSYSIWRVGLYSGIIAPTASVWAIVILIMLPSVLLYTVIATRSRHNRFISFLYTIFIFWFPALIYLFLGAVLVALIACMNMYLLIGIPLLTLSWTIVALVIASIIYGAVNANRIRITSYKVKAPELVSDWAGKKLVVFSDVHIGVVRGERFMKKIVTMVNDCNPDIAFLVGDVIDGPICDYQKGLAPLKNITAPLFYTLGNHEGYNQEPEKFYPVISSLTRMLTDEKVMMGDTQIIGLEYKKESKEETVARLRATGFDPAVPSIVMLHDPTNASVLEDEGVTLALSGHTHKGQFFPFTLFMKRMYKEFAYGENTKGATTVITTSGVGTTAPPIRLGSNPEIVVITII
jgi:uncharacterized protein